MYIYNRLYSRQNPLLEVDVKFSPNRYLLVPAVMLFLLLVSNTAFCGENLSKTGDTKKDAGSEWNFDSLKTAIAERVKVSGFLSVVGGAVVDGDRHTPITLAVPNSDCPCYVSNWSYGGRYNENFSIMPDSRAGLQANVKLTDDLNFVGQVTTRTRDLVPDVQWAYLSYKATKNIEIQAGRKRIPLYYFSQFQDVGFAYPWVSAPTELYGWEINNYNGVTARYQTRLPSFLFNTNLTATVFYGEDTVKNSKYNQLVSPESADTSWKDLIGGDVELTKSWWTLRLIYLQSRNNTLYKESDVRLFQNMRVYGVAFNGDFDDWFFFSEATLNHRRFTDEPQYTVNAPAYLGGVGYRVGKWTPFVSVGMYKENSTDPAYSLYAWITYSAVLRYDLTSNSAVKAQFSYNDDMSTDFTGDANIMRVSYDVVF